MRRWLTAALAAVALAVPVPAVAAPAPDGGGVLLVYLDGDGQVGARNPDSGIVADLAQRASRLGWVVFVPVPPGGESTWWRNGASNAGVVAGQIEAKAREVGASRVVVATFSGGSQLATKWLMPSRPDLFSGAVIVGGGGDPADDGGRALALPFPVWWVTGTNDTAANAEDGYDAVSDARSGAEAYARAGTRVLWSSPRMDHAQVREVIPALAVNGLSRMQ